MKYWIYLSIFYLSFFSETWAGRSEVWQSIKNLTSQNNISVYDNDFRQKTIQLIFDKRKDLDSSFSMLVYMGNISYLNEDKECIKTLFGHLKVILKEKKLYDSLNSQQTIDFLFKCLPKRIQRSKDPKLELYDFIHNRGRIILVMKLLYREAYSSDDVSDKLRQKIYSLCQKFLQQHNDYATH